MKANQARSHGSNGGGPMRRPIFHGQKVLLKRTGLTFRECGPSPKHNLDVLWLMASSLKILLKSGHENS